MSNLNPLYVLAFTFEQYFVDKDTGTALANGYIEFFQDAQRSVPKEVFTLTGTPGNYTYTSLGSVVNLNAVGVPEDSNGNNVPIYFFPYDGDESDTTGTVQLYYYAVFSEGAVEQFTRQAQPNIFQSSTAMEANNNYIPNGQFYLHNTIPATPENDFTEGEISEPITVIAPGGWTFEKPSGFTSVDNVDFSRIASVASTNPPDNPRYTVEIQNSNIGSPTEAFKYLCVKFGSVNKFSNNTDQTYTFVFFGQNAGLGNIPVNISLLSNYGTGGSAPAIQTLGSANISPTGTLYPIFFTFNNTTSVNIGPNNDDYFQLIISLPVSSVFQLIFGDFGLFSGELTNFTFIPTTDRQMMFQSMFGDFNWPNPTTYSPQLPLNTFPKYDGSCFYLPMVFSPNGISFDTSRIGVVVETTYATAQPGQLPCDGLVTYETQGYSNIGIPYSRLQSVLWNASANVPTWGTGLSYFTALINSSLTNEIIVSNNTLGSVTNAADSGGGTATGFTFTTIHKGDTGYFVSSYITGSGVLWIQNTNIGAVTAVGAGTSGFTVSTIQTGNTVIPQISQVNTTVATSLASDYFTFDSYDSGDVGYYVWFKVNGSGTDPAPSSRTGILVELLSTDTAAVVAQKIQESLNGWQVTTIDTVAASTPIPPGAYFTISSTGNNYYVWYTVNGSGTDPAPTGRIAIPVAILSTDTAAQVATKTLIAINMKYFATPDLRGTFIRGWNNGATDDPDAATRFSLVPGIQGDTIGTLQLSNNLSHFHTFNLASGSSATGMPFTVNGGPSASNNTSSTGGSQSRPINTYLNRFIYY